MKLKGYFAAAAVAMVCSGPAVADGMLTTCKEDIDTYCNDVEPGDGRFIACLYAHTATLSDECYAATEDFGRLLEWFFDRAEEVSEACAEDLQTHCSKVEVGQGRAFRCLRENNEKLNVGCAAMLETFRRK